MPYTSYSSTISTVDDFYEYCLGPWLEQARIGDSYTTTVRPINEQINTSAGKNITYLINLYRNRTTDELKTAAYKYVGPLEEEIGAVTTQDEAYAY